MPEAAPSATLFHRALLILLALTHVLAVMAWLVLSRFTANLISKDLGDIRFADDPAADQTSAGWDERVPMLADIPRHGTIRCLLEVSLPARPGSCRPDVSVVAEWGFWPHDHGMPILRTTDRNQVP